MEKAIIVRNLYKNFYFFKKDFHILQWLFTKKGYEKERKVLKDISFEVGKGEIVGLIGINGAGKSTLMKLIAGITYPSSGNIKVNGKVGSLINLSAGFHPDYTGRKTSVYKGYKQDKIEMRGDRAEMSDFPLYLNTVAGGLDRRDQTIGGFSFVVKIYALPVVEIIG